MAAAAPHTPPTNHRSAAVPRDLRLGSDGAGATYFRLGSNGGCLLFRFARAPPRRHVAGAGAAPGSSGRRRVPPLGRAGGGGERRSGVPVRGVGGGTPLRRRACPSPRGPGAGRGP